MAGVFAALCISSRVAEPVSGRRHTIALLMIAAMRTVVVVITGVALVVVVITSISVVSVTFGCPEEAVLVVMVAVTVVDVVVMSTIGFRFRTLVTVTM